MGGQQCRDRAQAHLLGAGHTSPSTSWWQTMAGRQALSRPSAAEGGGQRPALTGLAVRPNSATKVDAQTPHGRTPPPLCGESLQPGASPRSGRLTAERPAAQARASTSCRPRPPQGPLACSTLARANKYFSLKIAWRRYKQHVPQSRPAANGFDGPYGLQGGSILMSRGGSILVSAKEDTHPRFDSSVPRTARRLG